VTVVRELYVRFQRLIHEAAKFGIVGVVGVLITNGGYALLHSTFGLGPVTATTIATIVATAVSYVANRYWSFRHRERTSVAREGVIFFILNGVGLLIQDAVVAFNFYILSNGHNKAAEFIALNVGIALATLFRFWSYRKWVWAAPAEETGAGARGDQPPVAPSRHSLGGPAPCGGTPCGGTPCGGTPCGGTPCGGAERGESRARPPARERARRQRPGGAHRAVQPERLGQVGTTPHGGRAAARHCRYALMGLRWRRTPPAARQPGPAAAGRSGWPAPG